MPKTSRPKISAEEIAEKASRGEDVSAYFTNKFTVVRPVRHVSVDLTAGMLRRLDEQAARLNVSRQAVIKTLLGRALEEERSAKMRTDRRADRLDKARERAFDGEKNSAEPTLVIHAPERAAELGKRSFDSTLEKRVGEDYAINRNLFKRLKPGCPVILLSKDEKKRAEGKLVELRRTTVAENGVQRYDVHMEDLKVVDYGQSDEIRFNKCGVAVIESGSATQASIS